MIRMQQSQHQMPGEDSILDTIRASKEQVFQAHLDDLPKILYSREVENANFDYYYYFLT
jgi:hypothetical protein